MKNCRLCHTDKPKTDFYKASANLDGLRSTCKDCDKEYAKKRYGNKKEKIISKQMERYWEKREELLAYAKANRVYVESEEKECMACGKKELVAPQSKAQWKYCDKCSEERRKELRRIRDNERRKNDPTYRLNKNMGHLLWAGLKHKRKGSIKKKLPYTLEELKEHLESQFKRGMNWDNYGEWHIDHIKPRSAFHFETPDDHGFRECWNLDNLQPLWDYENIEKGNEY